MPKSTPAGGDSSTTRSVISSPLEERPWLARLDGRGSSAIVRHLHSLCYSPKGQDLTIVDKLKAKAQQTPSGPWVEGFFFDDTKLKDKRALNIRDLDEVSKDPPVVVRHRGGHTYFYNSKAFELAGVSKNGESDGRHVRQGRQGRVERARDGSGVSRVQQSGHEADVHAGADRAARARPIAHISKQFARYGLTSVHHQGGAMHLRARCTYVIWICSN
jgi:predicted amidohydrolase YtcJ